MKSVVKQITFLKFLNESSPKVRNILLKNLTRQQKEALLQIVVNLLHNNIPLNEKQKKGLCKHKNKLRKICDSCFKRNKIINKQGRQIEQIGGALPFILPAIIGLIAKAAATGAVSAGTGYVTKKIIDSATK